MIRPSDRSISLSGVWQFRADANADWQEIPVPGCWENLGLPHDWEGPGWYRRVVPIPEAWRSVTKRRLWLRFGAVSYACQVWANGVEIGEHIGAWDSFVFEVTEATAEVETLEILVRVLKPGGETYPTNQTTAGFLPYVWGYLFGGIWQDVTLEVTGPVRLPDTPELGGEREEGRTLWSPETPHLHTLTFQADADGVLSDEIHLLTGFRDVTVEGDTPLLNGKPFYPRMPLSWGWYPETLHCNPPIETMRDELQKIRALGYNGVKCCLWVPPPAYLDLCDELGMLVWLELPLWLPEMNEEQRERTFREYEAIVTQVRHHPSIVIWTLGCELSASCPDAFLRRLYERVKDLTGSPLVRDNSGGGECYGGLLQEHADYYDYHFYCDLPFLRNTFDYFLPRWRPAQPWLFGEFCDADAFRDLAALAAKAEPEEMRSELRAASILSPWWTLDDPAINPKGVRWDMNILSQPGNSAKYGLEARRTELKAGQQRQTLLHRKYTVELVRSYREMSGYVVTGLRDTPISIAGMFDDFGDFRYTSEEFTRFNADTVLFLGWHRRRHWNAGGDRPSYIDHHCHWAGETLLPRLGISHYGTVDSIHDVVWTLREGAGENIASGVVAESQGTEIPTGTMQQLGLIMFTAPPVEKMTRFVLSAFVHFTSGLKVQNEWPLWIVPKPDWNTLPEWASYDLEGKLTGLEQHGATWQTLQTFSPLPELEEGSGVRAAGLMVASRWASELAEWARNGGRAFVFVEKGGGLPVVECPFWREAMKLFEPHPLWNEFPQEGFTDLQFYGLGPDCAFDADALAALLPDAELRPILRRVDARTFAVTDYLTEANFPGGGCLLLTTLRPHGGLGDQPDGMLRHVAGVQFLIAALQSLTAPTA